MGSSTTLVGAGIIKYSPLGLSPSELGPFSPYTCCVFSIIADLPKGASFPLMDDGKNAHDSFGGGATLSNAVLLLSAGKIIVQSST